MILRLELDRGIVIGATSWPSVGSTTWCRLDDSPIAVSIVSCSVGIRVSDRRSCCVATLRSSVESDFKRWSVTVTW